MPALPGPLPPDEGKSDKDAKRESDFFERRPSVPPLTESERKRIALADDLRAALYWGAQTLVRVVAILLIAAVMVWWWHLIAPDKWRWLTADQSSHLQGLLLSGAISALVTAIGSKAF